jgi:hypothetical protein
MLALYLGGSVLMAALVTMVSVSVLTLTSGGELADLPGGFWTPDHVLITGFILIVFASACFILAELSRRGRIQQDRDGGMFGFGANRSETGRVSVGVRLFWIAVGLVTWGALVPLPLVLGNYYYAEADLWMIVSGYGFVTAGMVGVMITSLVKAAFHDRAVADGRFVHLSEATGKKPKKRLPAGQKFWHAWSYQMRIELWAGFAAGAAFGLVPLALAETGTDCSWGFADCVAGIPSLVLSTVVTGVVLAIGAVLLASQTWRSGEHLTAAESMASGPRVFQKTGG